MIPAKWKTMRPATSRQWSALITAALTGIVWRWLDPEGLKPVAALLAYWWVVFPAIFGFFIIDGQLMQWFGKRDGNGKIEEWTNPTTQRLDNIEAAINRLHEYVQEIDPDLAEERRLEEQFERGDSLFAGANLAEYEREREQSGKRTKWSHNIWQDKV